ncbi:MAG: hypothetical protein GC182_16065 [Rhodopseudomonas sp.]|nr:hypothetical protein [Rhodopseudomonas sp.]
MNWIPKQGHNATDVPTQNTSAFYCRAAVNLQFDNRDFNSDAGLNPKLPDPCRRQNGTSGLDVMDCDDIADVVSENDVRTNATWISVIRGVLIKKTLFNVVY